MLNNDTAKGISWRQELVLKLMVSASTWFRFRYQWSFWCAMSSGTPKLRFIIVTGWYNLHTDPYVEGRGYLLKVMYRILMWPIRTEDFNICALLTCYAVYSGNSILTFEDNLSVRLQKSRSQIIILFLTLLGHLRRDRKLSWNVGAEMPLYTV